MDRGAQQLLHGHSWNHNAPPQSDRRKLTPGDELAGEASGDVQQVGRFVHGQHEAIADGGGGGWPLDMLSRSLRQMVIIRADDDMCAGPGLRTESCCVRLFSVM